MYHVAYANGRLLSMLLMTAFLMIICTTMIAAKEVNFWTWTAGDRLREEDQILNPFREQHPHINLVYSQNDVRRGEALLVAIIGDAAPDLVTTHQDWHRDFAGQNAFLDLRPYIERDEFDMSVFPEDLMKFYTGPSGEITGFPWQFTTIVLGYNTRIFDEAAVAYPTSDWELDNLVDAARKFTVQDSTGFALEQWGLHTGVLWQYIWRLWGLDFMDEDGSRSRFSDPRAVEAFDWYARLFTVENVAHSDVGGSSNLSDWMNGKIAMTLNWPSYLTLWGDHLANEWDIEEIPTGPIGRKVARGATAGWAIPINAKNPDEAWEVLKHLASYEAQMAMLQTGRGGVSLSALVDYSHEIGAIRNVPALINAYTYASIDNYPTDYQRIHSEILYPSVRRLITGQVAPQSAVPEMARQIDARIAEVNSK